MSRSSDDVVVPGRLDQLWENNGELRTLKLDADISVTVQWARGRSRREVHGRAWLEAFTLVLLRKVSPFGRG